MTPTPRLKALLVSGREQSLSRLREMLGGCRFGECPGVRSGAEARRWLLGEKADLVIVNAPLPDEFGHLLARHAAETTLCGVLLLVKTELFEEVASGVEEAGVLVVPKPLRASQFRQALHMAAAVGARLRRAEAKARGLEGKLDELRIVSRAKCVLIEVLQMSEADAHRYIEKQAMDRRQTRREVAESLLKAYEQ